MDANRALAVALSLAVTCLGRHALEAFADARDAVALASAEPGAEPGAVAVAEPIDTAQPRLATVDAATEEGARVRMPGAGETRPAPVIEDRQREALPAADVRLQP